jgi:hypothetical protein
MSKHSGDVDVTHFVTLRPSIVRAFWDTPRAWSGAKVGLVVETRWVPDGEPIEIAIVADRGRSEPVEKLPTAKVKQNRCTVKHELAWSSDHLDGVPDDGPPVNFYFVARIARFDIELRSNALYVDRGTWSHSS